MAWNTGAGEHFPAQQLGAGTVTPGGDIAVRSVTVLPSSPYTPLAGLPPGGVGGLMFDNGGMFFNAKHPTVGLKGNANAAADGSGAAGQAVFTSASAGFTAADQGKWIAIDGAGAAGVLLTTTILTFTNSTTVVLATNILTTVSGAARFSYGTDDSVAGNAFIALVPSGSPGIAIWFPTARYLMGANPLTVTGRTDIQLFGTGPNSSMLLSGGNHDVVLFTGVCYRIGMVGFWIGSFGVRTAGFGVNINGGVGSPSRDILVENIIIENTFRAANFLFVQHSRGWNVKYIQSYVGASGAGGLFYFQSAIGGNYKDFDIQSTSGALGTANAQFGGDGLNVDSNCDSLEFDGWNIVGGGGGFGAGNGIICNNSQGGAGARLIRFQNMWVESWPTHGINVQAGRDLHFTTCHTWVNSQHGTFVVGGTSVTFSDHSSVLNQNHGIRIAGGTAIKLWNPTVSDNSAVADSTWDGIRVDNAMVGNVDIVGGKSGNFIFAGANQQQYGLRIGQADATDNVFVLGLDVRGNRQTVNSILVSITSTTGNVRVYECPGFNPYGLVTAPAFPATTVDVINSTGLDVVVWITSGTNAITVVKIGGTTVTGLTVGAAGALSQSIPLPAGQKINLTYVAGGAPSWQWFN